MSRPTRAFRCLALLSALAVFAAAAAARADEQPAVEILLQTGTTILGQPIEYPAGAAAQITAVIVTLEPGQETGRHRHAAPLFAQVLSGQVTIDYDGHGSKTFSAGESFVEAVGTWHNGRNSGGEEARILAVILGSEGVANTERP